MCEHPSDLITVFEEPFNAIHHGAGKPVKNHYRHPSKMISTVDQYFDLSSRLSIEGKS
jgi:hypothetical protein